MVEPIGTIDKIEDDGLRSIGAMTRKASDALAGSTWGAHFLALGVGYAINAFVSYRDYKARQNHLRKFYDTEIAAIVGKSPAAIGIDDVKKVAQKNPIIGQALRRIKSNRNMEFVVGAVATTVAIFATSYVLGPAVLGFAAGAFTIGSFLTGAALGLGFFLATEKSGEYVARKMLGLNEPKLIDVARNPALQSRLSLPSQVHFLERLQHRINPRDPRSFISQEQVLTLFLSANPDLDGAIRARYGKAFGAMGVAERVQVMNEVGPTLKLERLTENLNSRVVRAQELAFAAVSQESGVAPLESPRLSALEKNLAAAEQKIGQLTQKVKETSSNAADAVTQGLRHCFGKSTVCGVVPSEQAMAKAALIPMEGQIAVGSATQRLLDRRQQSQQAAGAGMNA